MYNKGVWKFGSWEFGTSQTVEVWKFDFHTDSPRFLVLLKLDPGGPGAGPDPLCMGIQALVAWTRADPEDGPGVSAPKYGISGVFTLTIVYYY